MRLIFVIFTVAFLNVPAIAQPTPFFLKGALKENRQQLYRNLVNNSILKNLSLPLNDSTEDYWQDAFWAMELIGYRSAYTNNRIRYAFDNINRQSHYFQRSLLELAFTNSPELFISQVKALVRITQDDKVFAMCTNYLLLRATDDLLSELSILLNARLKIDRDDPILQQLAYQIESRGKSISIPDISSFLAKEYLPNQVIMISLQRSNRNFPGLVVVKDQSGNLVKNPDGSIFSVPQLARSISNLPGYLTNGNTPEGLFRMDGFDTSGSSFIGPTTNIQLTMPFEFKASHFFKDGNDKDSAFTLNRYKELLPLLFQNYYPMFQSYYAGKAGRTEIIAHGTTIDPNYYKGKPYYPLTPTQGCLCTREIWNDQTGRLQESDQQKLIEAVIKGGGPDGYAVIINIDDQESAVIPEEAIKLLKRENK